MSKCWICDQKAAWKREKLNAARAAAKLLANEQGETLVIIKEAGIYKTIPASAAGDHKVVQYISKHQ